MSITFNSVNNDFITEVVVNDKFKIGIIEYINDNDFIAKRNDQEYKFKTFDSSLEWIINDFNLYEN